MHQVIPNFYMIQLNIRVTSYEVGRAASLQEAKIMATSPGAGWDVSSSYSRVPTH